MCEYLCVLVLVDNIVACTLQLRNTQTARLECRGAGRESLIFIWHCGAGRRCYTGQWRWAQLPATVTQGDSSAFLGRPERTVECYEYCGCSNILPGALMLPASSQKIKRTARIFTAPDLICVDMSDCCPDCSGLAGEIPRYAAAVGQTAL